MGRLSHERLRAAMQGKFKLDHYRVAIKFSIPPQREVKFVFPSEPGFMAAASPPVRCGLLWERIEGIV